MPRILNRFDAGWNEALRWAIGGFIGVPDHMELSHGEKEGLRLAGILCFQGFVKRSQRTVAQEIRAYRISRRTYFNWKRAGCPFDQGKNAVLDWMTRRRQLPARCREKFAEELPSRELRQWRRDLVALARESRESFRALRQARRAK